MVEFQRDLRYGIHSDSYGRRIALNGIDRLGAMCPPSPRAWRLRGKAHLTLMAVALSLAGCSSFDNLNPFGSEKYSTRAIKETPAEDIYNQGLARLQKRDSEAAARSFTELDRQYPYSDWSKKGLMMTTYAQYQGGQYDEAVQSANRYVNLYPSSTDTPYAYYLAGMSYYNQIPDISRDQERAEKALKLFQTVVDKYPKSEYAEDARFKIQVTADQLAGKDMSVGRYYLARKSYTAAINRFRNVLAKYQTTRHTEEALERLTEAYLGLGIDGEAQTAAAVLGHNFPDSQWYKDAYSQLKGEGLDPKEDQSSWISKIFRKVMPG